MSKAAACMVLASVVAFAPALHADATVLTADKVLVEKAARRLTLLRAGVSLKTYRIALGTHPIGPKETQADGRTPEGAYVVDGRKADSGYHRALHISYPNAHDRSRAAALRASPGGDIMIHGAKNGMGWLGSLHRAIDWTQGCIAVTDEEIEEIWSAVPNGTPVEILP
jgi:murein L,D-transpeptidase YafK